MKKLGDLMMILDLHRQGLKLAAIARQVGMDRKNVRKYIASGLEPPPYGPRHPHPRAIDDYVAYLRAILRFSGVRPCRQTSNSVRSAIGMANSSAFAS